MNRHLELDDDAVALVHDAYDVLKALDDVRPHELTPLHYAAQYDNLQIVIRDLLRVLGVDPDEPWPECPHLY